MFHGWNISASPSPLRLRVVALFAAGAALTARAGQTDLSGLGAAIPDNTAAGVTSEIVVSPEQAVLVDAIVVRIEGFNHGWCGEIEISLDHVDSGRTAILVQRIGALSPDADGDSSNFAGLYGFGSASSSDIWMAAAGVGASAAIPNRDYQPSGVGSGADNHALDFFLNQSPVGVWRLRVADRRPGIVGTFGGWRLVLGTPPPCRPCGDANCDGFVTIGDIGAFVTAITDFGSWKALFAEADLCDAECSLDTNRDGQITVGDIGAFVGALTGTPCGVAIRPDP